MNKMWLIRTSKKQIAGPVSTEKVLQFIKKDALKDEDEICSGNGYWFYLREKDLVDQFLIGKEIQPFNQITEAITVLAQISDDSSDSAKKIEPEIADDITVKTDLGQHQLDKKHNANLPSDLDLEFPNVSPDSGSVMAISTVEKTPEKIQQEQNKKEAPKTKVETGTGTGTNEFNVPDASDLEFPNMGNTGETLPDQNDLEYPDISPSKPELKPEPKTEPDIELELELELEDINANFSGETSGEKMLSSCVEINLQNFNAHNDNSSLSLDLSKTNPDRTEKELRIKRLQNTINKGTAEVYTQEINVDELHDAQPNKPSSPPRSINKTIKSRPQQQNRGIAPPHRAKNDSFLIYLFLIIVVIIAVILFYYTKILKTPIVTLPSLFGSEAYAQTLDNKFGKKKGQISFHL